MPVISSATVIYDQATRAGFSGAANAWFDGIHAVLSKSGSNFLGFGADGESGLIRTVGPVTDPAASNSRIDLSGLKPVGISYIGGGPTVRVDASTIATVMHLERFPAHGFWSSFGLAKSVDDGLSFSFLGEYLQMALAYDAGEDTYQHDMQGGPIVPFGTNSPEHYYKFFREHIGRVPATDSYHSLARCSIADFNAAVLADTAPTFDKWQGGNTWGGSNTGAATNLPTTMHWIDVWWDLDESKFLAVGVTEAGDPSQQKILYSTSEDGMVWATPADVSTEFNSTPGDEAASYSSLIPTSIGSVSRSGHGPWTVLYDFGVRWTDTAVKSRTMNFSADILTADQKARMGGSRR